MIKRIIISVVFCMILVGTYSIFDTSYHTIVTNEVAVNQVEDSDENFIAMRHVDAPKTAVSILMWGLMFGVLYVIWANPIKKQIEYLKENS